jgi:ferredoxin-like protein FixX
VRADGTFIAVEVDDAVAGDAELARKLADACPVDIFVAGDGGVQIAESNVDECVLCRLCLDAAGGAGADAPVKIIKLYDDGALLD